MDFCTGAPLLGDLLREVVWPTDVSTLMLMQWWYAKPPTVSAAYPFTGNGRATFAASENRLGPDLAAFCPEQERKELIEMLASRPGMTINWHENR